eukprot:CAMPEP_0196577564 /NCGR_PEP_ID=MMETSP1081-20130531/6616_1 /TAXON_ID=36882 /ORGANISM="Pyramimonas amylifera, Strain CCMP720" /LENGTH=88 /DNA_ID=CAMNT_0041896523 /DNA_START=206 /DNA_END=472 /DNA_ORIENTATION=+
MTMDGQLFCDRPNSQDVDVVANANLAVACDLPSWMSGLPGVQGVGDSILAGILEAIRLVAHFKLEADYLDWVSSQIELKSICKSKMTT